MKIYYQDIYDAENNRRQISSKKDYNNENVIASMNYALSKFNNTFQDTIDVDDGHPLIIPFGLPRSATTLLTQVIISYFDVGYVDNIIARFWESPIYGIALSNALLKEKHNSFSSNYGKTLEISSPHEFSYFWHKWMSIDSLYDLDIERIKRDTNWIGLSNILTQMSIEFDKPMVMKGF
mgnify:FL=1